MLQQQNAALQAQVANLTQQLANLTAKLEKVVEKSSQTIPATIHTPDFASNTSQKPPTQHDASASNLQQLVQAAVHQHKSEMDQQQQIFQQQLQQQFQSQMTEMRRLLESNNAEAQTSPTSVLRRSHPPGPSPIKKKWRPGETNHDPMATEEEDSDPIVHQRGALSFGEDNSGEQHNEW